MTTIRTDEEVVDVLLKLYDDEFGGKTGQQYVMTWSDLRAIRGGARLETGVFNRLWSEALERDISIVQLDSGSNPDLVVIRKDTTDRWRRVPRKTIKAYAARQTDQIAEKPKPSSSNADAEGPRGMRMPVRVHRII
jgi:hypothetical protein